MIDKDGVRSVKEKIEAVVAAKTPVKIERLQLFLRMANYYGQIYSKPLNYSSYIKPIEKTGCSMQMDTERRGSLSEIEETVEFSKGVNSLQPKATIKIRLQRLICENRRSVVSHHGNRRRKTDCLCLQITDQF